MIKTLDDEILNKIKEMTGAVGVFLVIADTQMPCADVRAGEDCRGKHSVLMGAHNVNPVAIIEVIANATGAHMVGINPEDADELHDFLDQLKDDDEDIPYGS